MKHGFILALNGGCLVCRTILTHGYKTVQDRG